MSDAAQDIPIQNLGHAPECAQCSADCPAGYPEAARNGGRTELVIGALHVKGSIRLLNALHDFLPSMPEPTLREALIRLLVLDPAAANKLVADHKTMPRDLVNDRIVVLEQKHDDIQELLNALPLRMPTEGADRALRALVADTVL